MNMTDFMRWIRETAESVDRDKYRVITRDKYTIVINERNGKVGMARLHPDDERIRDYGISLAYCRCKGIEFPKITEYKTLYEMKNGEIFLWKGEHYRFIGRNGQKFFTTYNLNEKEHILFHTSLIKFEMSD